jgi:hypothetical protein
MSTVRCLNAALCNENRVYCPPFSCMADMRSLLFSGKREKL